MDHSITHWINTELGSVNIGDTRLNNRFLQIAKQLATRFGRNISSSFDQWKDIKAAYRFFSNKKVKMSNILAPHIEETIKRVKKHNRVFLVQDTTYFNFSNREKTSGLDITQRSKLSKEAEGLMLHNTLAISESGIPLGLIDQYFIDRKYLQGNSHEEQRKLRHWNNNVYEKESVRWINTLNKANHIEFGETQIIHMADRESDFYEFFREAATLGEHVLIRAAQNRSINKEKRREFPSTYLFDHLREKRAQGKMTIKLQVNGKEKYRQACLSIIYSSITMPAPPNKTKKKDGDLPMVELFAIMAIERNPPKNSDPLCWVLLTDMEVNTLDQAIEKVRWYSLRWNIELFHKVLKSGCGVEKVQLRDAERLKKYIVFKSVIAWRLFWLSRVWRDNERDSCLTALSQNEWKILYRKTHKTKVLPDTPPTIGEVYLWIAKLGGYIGRRTDPPPGMISLWRGFQRLMDMVEDFYDICG